MEKLIVAGFDPPASSNLGWAIFFAENKTAKHISSGILVLPDIEAERLLCIRDFLIDLIEKYGMNVMCFERAIGHGVANVREMIGENTGVIKLVGASYNVKIEAIHTSTMGKIYTGSGTAKGKKSRIKDISRSLFFPSCSYKEIATNESGNEYFEHQADAIGFAATYLLQKGIKIEGDGGYILPNELPVFFNKEK